MKNRESVDQIDKILSTFTVTLDRLNNFKSILETNYEKIQNEYKQSAGKLEADRIIGWQSMTYFNLIEDSHDSLSPITYTYNNYINTGIEYHNKQLQWLLVDAYEAYDDFLNNLFAYFAYYDNNVWDEKKLGKIQTTEGNSQDIEWFIVQIKKKKKYRYVLYNSIAEKLTNLKFYQTKNAFNINLEFEISLITQLRHRIVHNAGVIKNEKKFHSDVLDKISIDEIHSEREHYLKMIGNYIGESKARDRVEAVLISSFIKDGSSAQFDRLNHMFMYLLSSTMLIANLSKEYFSTEGKHS